MNFSPEDTQKVAKCSLFQCSELKGGSRRPSQPKTISFHPHSRSTSADPNPTGLTNFLFILEITFSKSKIGAKTSGLQKKKVCGCPVRSASLIVWAPFFGTVLFLVNENMVPLAYSVFICYHAKLKNHKTKN